MTPIIQVQYILIMQIITSVHQDFLAWKKSICQEECGIIM